MIKFLSLISLAKEKRCRSSLVISLSEENHRCISDKNIERIERTHFSCLKKMIEDAFYLSWHWILKKEL